MKPTRIRTVAAACLVILVPSVTVTLSAPAASATTARTANTYVESGCDVYHPDHIDMFRSDGSWVNDLYLCASPDYQSTAIVNTSTSKVWYLASQAYPYWTRTQDRGLPLKVWLFREGLRRYYRTRWQIPPPHLTSEPDTTITIPVGPWSIRLDQDPHEQFAWATVNLSVKTFTKKAPDWVVDVLGHRSPTRKAVLKCVAKGYEVASDVTSDEPPSLTLRDGLGLWQDASECSDGLERAKEQTAGETPVLTAEDLALRTERPGWSRITNSRYYRAFYALVVHRG